MTQTRFDLTDDDLAWVRRRSQELTDAVGAALPRSMREAFWPAFAEAFRMYSAAPQIANQLLAAKALEAAKPSLVEVHETVSRDWWSLQGTVAEAVFQEASSRGIHARAVPGAGMRCLRVVAAEAGSLLNGALALCRKAREPRASSMPRPGGVAFLAIGSTCVTLAESLRSMLADEHGIESTLIGFEPGDVPHGQAIFAGPVFSPADFHTPAASWAGGRAWLASRLTFVGWRWRTVGQGVLRRFGRKVWAAAALRLRIALAQEAPCVAVDSRRAERMLDLLRPAAVVAFHLYSQGLAPFVLAAKTRGIPVIYVQHGVYLAKDRCIVPMDYDLNFVFGAASAEMVGLPGERTEVAGRCDGFLPPRPPAGGDGNGPTPPRFAGHPSRYPSSAGPGRGNDNGPATILAATQPLRPEDTAAGCPDRWLEGVAEAAKALGTRLVVKVHPAETDLSRYEALADTMPGTVIVVKADEASVTDLLRAADLLATRDSTVVFDANLAGVPVAVINLTGLRDRFPFVEDGGAEGVYRYEDILPVLDRLLNNGAARAALASRREAFIHRHLGPVDGRAAQRIAARIADLAAR